MYKVTQLTIAFCIGPKMKYGHANLIQPYGQIRPSGSALWFLIFDLLVFIYSAFRIRPYGPDSTKGAAYSTFPLYCPQT